MACCKRYCSFHSSITYLTIYGFFFSWHSWCWIITTLSHTICLHTRYHNMKRKIWTKAESLMYTHPPYVLSFWIRMEDRSSLKSHLLLTSYASEFHKLSTKYIHLIAHCVLYYKHWVLLVCLFRIKQAMVISSIRIQTCNSFIFHFGLEETSVSRCNSNRNNK